MEDEFYHLTVKGNDLKTYVRRFQELATLCPTMVPDSEKMMEVFIGGFPRSIERNVTAFKPQTLEEAIYIAQRLMDQVTKHTPMQVSSDHKQKFDDIRTFNNNNYRNDNNNNYLAVCSGVVNSLFLATWFSSSKPLSPPIPKYQISVSLLFSKPDVHNRMVKNSEKMMEVFIGGLPRSIEGNVTASKPQTF
ncbi:hypothetical protein Tco_1303866 [Tanacetum coccineum]